MFLCVCVCVCVCFLCGSVHVWACSLLHLHIYVSSRCQDNLICSSGRAGNKAVVQMRWKRDAQKETHTRTHKHVRGQLINSGYKLIISIGRCLSSSQIPRLSISWNKFFFFFLRLHLPAVQTPDWSSRWCTCGWHRLVCGEATRTRPRCSERKGPPWCQPVDRELWGNTWGTSGRGYTVYASMRI